MKKIDSYHYHEALDRTHMISCIFHDYIVEHKAVQASEELKAKADKIAEALGDFYQMCGTVSAEFDEKNGK